MGGEEREVRALRERGTSRQDAVLEQEGREPRLKEKNGSAEGQRDGGVRE